MLKEASQLIEQISAHPLYRQITSEDMSQQAIKDAELLLRKDGLIVNIEGWYHPEGMVVGETLYAPDPLGDKSILGVSYRKVTLESGTTTPVPYHARPALWRSIDPGLDQTATNPYFARYKHILPLNQFIARFDIQQSFMAAFHHFKPFPEHIARDIDHFLKLIDINPNDVSIGFTGAPLLGNVYNYHDVDLVFRGTLAQNHEIAKKMNDILLQEPWRRLYEGGKSWRIRLFNDNQKLMCNFFGYKEAADIPLREFLMSPITPVTVTGTVSNDLHSYYTPSLLELKETEFTDRHTNNDLKPDDPLFLVIYHTATRGECQLGDRIAASGMLVDIHTPASVMRGVCVIDRESVRNLTPPWPNYYQ